MKNKILLIDDEANKGWEAILKHLLFENDQVDSTTNITKAKDLIAENVYDLIFLDLRFGEKDHQTNRLEDFDGFKLLQKIKNEFLSKNFSTPIILFTASNKAWYINAMLDAGCDDFYIKEHPDTAYDEKFTKDNTKRLKSSVTGLLLENKNRKEIHNIIKSIIEKSENEIVTKNIKQRVSDKLKIGYGTLFRKLNSLEKNQLVFNNQEMAFIVFWSILEELSKDFFKDNWIKSGKFEGMMTGNNWTFRNNIQFIEDKTKLDSGGVLKSAIQWSPSKKTYVKSDLQIDSSDKNYGFYSGKINLSLQIYAVMLLYKNWDADVAKKVFSELNNYRNKIDFIHSSTSSIFEKSLTSKNNNQGFIYNLRMLNFIEDLLI